jgi:hypothetical protein
MATLIMPGATIVATATGIITGTTAGAMAETGTTVVTTAGAESGTTDGVITTNSYQPKSDRLPTIETIFIPKFARKLAVMETIFIPFKFL